MRCAADVSFAAEKTKIASREESEGLTGDDT